MNILRSSCRLGSAFALGLGLLASPMVSSGQALAHGEGKIHTEQVDISYETFGKSTAALPMVIVNGGPGLSHAYLLATDIWKQLAQKRQVIFYDQRGTGASKIALTGAPQTLDAQVADLEAVRNGLGISKFILVGDSYGGFLSIAYASAHPEHIAKLVLSAAAGSNLNDIVHLFDQVFPDAMEVEKQQEAKPSVMTKETADASMRNHFNLLFYSLGKRDLYFKKIGPMRSLGFDLAVSEAVSKDASKADFTSRLAGFRFPTLVIAGRYDMNVAPLTAWRLKQAIPGAQLVFFEQSGHFPWFEEPAKYRTVIEQFMDSQN